MIWVEGKKWKVTEELWPNDFDRRIREIIGEHSHYSFWLRLEGAIFDIRTLIFGEVVKIYSIHCTIDSLAVETIAVIGLRLRRDMI